MYPLDYCIKTDQGMSVPTAEHAYQAEKFENPFLHKRICNSHAENDDNRIYADGLAAKKLAHEQIARGVEIRSDWEIVKNGIMLAIVTKKFIRNPELAKKLYLTGDEEIVEGNDWGDRYWGVDPVGSDNGENQLGKILMVVRSRLQTSKES